MNRLAYALLCTAIVATACGSSARAHDRRVGYLTVVSAETTATLELTLRAIDLTAFTSSPAGGGADATTQLTRLLPVSSARGVCRVEPRSVMRLPSDAGRARFRWTADCGTERPAWLRDRIPERLVGHMLFVRTVTIDEAARGETVASERAPRVRLTDPPPARFASTFAAHVPLGVEHLATGLDHLAFLLLLLLGSRRAVDAVGFVSAFTVGHALTLVAATSGWLVARDEAVELLIALSVLGAATEFVAAQRPSEGERAPIVRAAGVFLLAVGAVSLPTLGVAGSVGTVLFGSCWLALSNRGGTGKLAIVTLFGTLHGLGFAGALRDAFSSRDDLVPALLGWNVGIELAQIAVVLVAWPLIVWLRARPRAWGAATVLVVALTSVAAGAWLVERMPTREALARAGAFVD